MGGSRSEAAGGGRRRRLGREASDLGGRYVDWRRGGRGRSDSFGVECERRGACAAARGRWRLGRAPGGRVRGWRVVWAAGEVMKAPGDVVPAPGDVMPAPGDVMKAPGEVMKGTGEVMKGPGE